MAGNSFFWSNFGGDAYYNRNVVSWLKEDWNANIVRAAMGIEEFNGFLSNPELNRNAVRAVVEAAIAEDIYVIIDWHTHNAEANTQAAVDFFLCYGARNTATMRTYCLKFIMSPLVILTELRQPGITLKIIACAGHSSHSSALR